MEPDLEAGSVEAERRSEAGSQTSLPHRGQTPTSQGKARDDGPGGSTGRRQDGRSERQPSAQSEPQTSTDHGTPPAGQPADSGKSDAPPGVPLEERSRVVMVPAMSTQKRYDVDLSRRQDATAGRSAFPQEEPTSYVTTTVRQPEKTVATPEMSTQKRYTVDQSRRQDATAGRSAFPQEETTSYGTPLAGNSSVSGPSDAQTSATGAEPVETFVTPLMSTQKRYDVDLSREQDPTAGRSAYPQGGPHSSAVHGAHSGGQSAGDLGSDEKPGGPSETHLSIDQIERMQKELQKMKNLRMGLAPDIDGGMEQPQTKVEATSRMGNPAIATLDNPRKQDATPVRTTNIGLPQPSPDHLHHVDDCAVCTTFAQRKELHEEHKARHKALHDPESDEDEDDKRKHSATDKGFIPAFREAYRAARGKNNDEEDDEDDPEEVRTGPKRNKEKYDIHGRKYTWSRKRLEREQPWTPKKHFYPRTLPPPEPTYLDRHGKTELQVFQALVGVHFLDNAGAPLPAAEKQQQPASVMADIFWQSRAAAWRHRNRGLYDRCISEDMKMRVMYSFSHYVISFLYILQIFVAATLTGLSAYTDIAGGSTAVTVLGAINTVLAGVLAWLTGKGMPIRYRRARDQFREVVREIEASERMFAVIDYMDWPEGKRPTPIGERDRLEKLYEEARQDQEANYPDTHEGPDKNAQAAEAKTLKEKAQKHKDEKKAAAAALEDLKEERQALKAGAVELERELERRQGGVHELERNEKALRKMYEEFETIRDAAVRRNREVGDALVRLCRAKGLSADEVTEEIRAHRREEASGRDV